MRGFKYQREKELEHMINVEMNKGVKEDKAEDIAEQKLSKRKRLEDYDYEGDEDYKHAERGCD